MSTEPMPDTAPMQSAGTDLVTRAEAMKVTNAEQFQEAGQLLLDAKALVRKIQGEFAPSKKAAHEAHKSVVQLEARMLEAPQHAENVLKRVIGAWQAAETKRIRDEEQRLAAIARKEQEDRQLAEAAQLEASGQKELAEEVVSRPVVAPVVSIPKPAVRGVTTVMLRRYRIVDASKINRQFLIPDETAIRKVVEALGKDAEQVVGGIVFEEVPSTRVGSR